MFEMRWLETPCGDWKGGAVGILSEGERVVRVLQYREYAERGNIPAGQTSPYFSWSEWKDIPVVRAGAANIGATMHTERTQ